MEEKRRKDNRGIRRGDALGATHFNGGGRLIFLFAAMVTLLAVCVATPWSTARTASSKENRTAREFFVSPAGRDQNPGSASKPWRTISRATLEATGGSTIHVAPGSYFETISSRISGTPTDRIRFVSDVRWGAKIVSAAVGSAAAWRNEGSYVNIEGFDISCPKCYFGIWNWGSYVSMNYNHIHDMASSGTKAGAGIDNNGYSAWGNEEIGNVIHHIGVPGNGAHQHGIYHASPGGRVMNNILYHNEGWGINLRHGAQGPMVIANNTIFANGGTMDGRHYVGGGIVFDATDAGATAPLDNCTFVNNLIYGNNNMGMFEGTEGFGTGRHNIIQNNLIYGNVRGNRFINGHLGRGSDVNRIETDPQFVNYRPELTFSDGDYHLKPASPARRSGTALGMATSDLDNHARPSGTAIDIGAYQHEATAKPRSGM